MEKLSIKKFNAYQTLNVVWGVLTSLFLLLALYLIWQNAQHKMTERVETAIQRISETIEDYVSHLIQTLYSTSIVGHEFTNCEQSILSQLQHVVFNNPNISAVTLLDRDKNVLCSTMPKHQVIKTPLDSRTLTLFGPFQLGATDKPALIIQQQFGNYNINIYILKSKLATALRSDPEIISRIALYDEQRKNVLIEITPDINKKDAWRITPSHQNALNALSIEGNNANIVRDSLSGLAHLEVVVERNQQQLFYLSMRYMLMATTVMLLMAFSIYYYLRMLIGQHFSLHRAIVTGIKQKNFFPVYQPIINRRLNSCVGAEVLLRWQTGANETIMPDTFIEYAEQSGLIVPITMQLSEIVFTECQPLLRSNPNFHLSINLSATHFTDAQFLDKFIELCDEYAIPHQQIILEVTERDLLQNDLTLIDKMKKLRHAGFSLAVDDFGTGHASISYLQHFPFNYLKIDRLFILSIGTGAVTEALNQSIIDMAKRLGLHVVAEGVETQQQLETLEENGAYLMQGWYFSKALSFENLIQYIKRNFDK